MATASLTQWFSQASPATIVLLLIAAAVGVGMVLGILYAVVGYVASRGPTHEEEHLEDDYPGSEGQVVLPVGTSQQGKVRLQLRGREIELPAISADENLELGRGDDCVILEVDAGVAKVTRVQALAERIDELEN